MYLLHAGIATGETKVNNPLGAERETKLMKH